VHLFIRRFLRFFDSYTIRYEGAGISNNEFYAGKHWTVRAGIKKKYAKIFSWLIKGKAKKYDTIGMVLFYNSRHDTDNVVSLQKLLIDSLKGKYIKDDSTKYMKFTAQVFDPTLPHNTFEFVIIKL
jgi:antitoxin component YwqK of YwqJK toxin-antitoxin module